tara:strand:- start:764 stop:955 length:192 start_codon:yes stop_codon:yes gene_type:complete
MTFKEFLQREGLSLAKFSKISNIPEPTLNKYKYKNRIPQKENMLVITELTNGEVKANDFYYEK